MEDSASVARGRAMISADYRNSEVAWAVGIHLYAIVMDRMRMIIISASSRSG